MSSEFDVEEHPHVDSPELVRKLKRFGGKLDGDEIREEIRW